MQGASRLGTSNRGRRTFFWRHLRAAMRFFSRLTLALSCKRRREAGAQGRRGLGAAATVAASAGATRQAPPSAAAIQLAQRSTHARLASKGMQPGFQVSAKQAGLGAPARRRLRGWSTRRRGGACRMAPAGRVVQACQHQVSSGRRRLPVLGTKRGHGDTLGWQRQGLSWRVGGAPTNTSGAHLWVRGRPGLPTSELSRLMVEGLPQLWPSSSALISSSMRLPLLEGRGGEGRGGGGGHARRRRAGTE
jgi:hypothetical protein